MLIQSDKTVVTFFNRQYCKELSQRRLAQQDNLKCSNLTAKCFYILSGDGVSQRGKRYKHGSPAFPPDMTPLELAAVNRKYKLIKLLLARGDEIEFPHALDCK